MPVASMTGCGFGVRSVGITGGWPCFTTGQGRGSCDRGCGRVAWYASALSTPNKSQLQLRDAAARLIPFVWLLVPCRPRPTSPHEAKSAIPTSAKLAAGNCRTHHLREQCSHDNLSATHSGSARAPSHISVEPHCNFAQRRSARRSNDPARQPHGASNGGVNPPSGGWWVADSNGGPGQMAQRRCSWFSDSLQAH